MSLVASRPSRWTVALVSALALVLPAAAQQPAANPAAGLPAGTPAPALEVDTLAGTRGPLEYAKGAPTVVLFFLAGCPTCKEMLPHWNRAFEKRPAGLRVVAVMLDDPPPGFFEATPIAFPVVRAADPRAAGQLFRITKVPMTLRVDAERRVADVGLGLLDEARLAQLFAR